MYNTANGLYELSYECDASASCLVVRTGAERELRQYHVEMLLRNTIEGILPMEFKQKDNRWCFYYNVTSRLALDKFLQHSRLKRNEFIHILSGITRTLLHCRNYLLDERCLVLEESCIFVNPATLEVAMVYLPFKGCEKAAASSLRNFVVGMITGTADIDDSSGDNFLHRILSCVKGDAFTVSELDSLLRKLADEAVKPVPPPRERAAVPGPQAEMAPPKPMAATSAVPGRKAEPAQAQKAQGAFKGLPGPAFLAGHLRLAAAVGVQALFAAAVFLGREALNSVSGDRVTTYAAVGLIIVALDVLLFRKLFGEGALKLSKKEAPPQAGGKTPKMEKPPADKKPAQAKRVPVVDKPPVAVKIPAIDHAQEGKPLKDGGVKPPMVLDIPPAYPLQEVKVDRFGGNETVLLGSTPAMGPHLMGVSGPEQEIIRITKKDFVIGRLSGRVDHESRNSAIGKVHAQISFRDGDYYITDLNSRNGTFINRERIISNKEYLIRHHDRIALANSEYIFIVPEEE